MFIDEHRDRFGGVEPICTVLSAHGVSFTPSTSYAAKKRQEKPSARAVRDEVTKELITAVYEANYRAYGARKVWRQLHRQGHAVARCTVERLMRELGIAGAVRGKKVIATIPEPTATRGVGERPVVDLAPAAEARLIPQCHGLGLFADGS